MGNLRIRRHAMNHLNLTITFAFVGLLPVLKADELVLTTNEQSEVRQTLEDFQNGKITLDAITVGRDEAWGRKLLEYFVTHTNDVTIKMKLPIARVFGAFDGYPQAAILAQEYVGVYLNDWHGWRILGSANFFMTNFSVALSAYTNAVRLGDDISYPALGASALKTDRLDIVSNMIPRFLALKSSNMLTNRNQALQLATVLVIYSLRTEQQNIFTNALANFEPKEILAHDDLTFLVKEGCKEFQGKDIEKVRQELETSEKP